MTSVFAFSGMVVERAGKSQLRHRNQMETADKLLDQRVVEDYSLPAGRVG